MPTTPVPHARSALRTAATWGARLVGGLFALVLVAAGAAYSARGARRIS